MTEGAVVTQAVKPASVGMLLELVKADIARNGASESFMIRSGLLLDVLNELYEHRQYRNDSIATASAQSTRERELTEALERIANAEFVDVMCDPGWPIRIARATLANKEQTHG
jgi:hypothetical protein